MASKKKQELSYLQLPLPSGRKAYKTIKREWSGLNYRQTIDTGALSMERNISTLEAPYLTPSKRRIVHRFGYEKPIGMFGFDDFLLVIYKDGSSIFVDYIKENGNVFTGILKYDNATDEDEYIQRSVVQFNVYDTPTDPVSGRYVKKLLIFPDKASMNFNFKAVSEIPEVPQVGVVYCLNENNEKQYVVYSSLEESNTYSGYFPISDLDVLVKSYSNSTPEEDESGATIYPPPDNSSHNYYYRNDADDIPVEHKGNIYRWCEYDTDDGGIKYGWKVCVPPSVPNIKYATVHLSRVFGVDDDRVYASGYNDYSNWNLDTVDEYNEANSWVSPAQSNTKADGAFTGITTFQNHVICFKRDFMHEIYNTKNPFRIQDIYGEGSIDNRTIQDVDGRLIFVSGDNVKVYTGSDPRIISHYLNMSEYEKAVSGTDGRCYYLYCEDRSENKRFFVYDTVSGGWSEETIDVEVLGFAHNKRGMYALCADGRIYKLDTKDYAHRWSFETDLFTNQTVDIKHVKKIQMFAHLADNANMKVYILYDDEEFSEDSHLVYESEKTGQIAIRVKPRQTANYGIKIHVEGFGYARLYEMELFIEAGGGLYAG